MRRFQVLGWELAAEALLYIPVVWLGQDRYRGHLKYVWRSEMTRTWILEQCEPAIRQQDRSTSQPGDRAIESMWLFTYCRRNYRYAYINGCEHWLGIKYTLAPSKQNKEIRYLLPVIVYSKYTCGTPERTSSENALQLVPARWFMYVRIDTNL